MPTKKEEKVSSEAGEKQEKKFDTPKLLRGMKDIIPQEEGYWNTILDTARNLAESYSFGRLRMPVLESTKLFVRSVGKHTDIVEKEMYTFEDLDGEKVTLRPEGTAQAVRAYITHGMLNQPQPVKLWYTGPMFRHERPQAGRYRQFHQVGFEVIGGEEAAVDAMLINIAYRIIKESGVETIIHINSIGCRDCRPLYVEELVAYYRTNRAKTCEDCKRRLTKNPLRVLDCKQEGCQEVKQGAPQIVDKLCEGCRKHFMQVLECCDELGIPYSLNPFLVRGLDYYARTVFECMPASEDEDGPAQSAFGGGGRYDYLVEYMGGRQAPAAGFAHGIERIVGEMRRKNVTMAREKRPQVFVAQLGDLARKKAMALFEEFRTGGFRVREHFAKSALSEQMKVADKCKAPFAVIVGQREVMEGTVIVRDMDSRIQEIVDRNKVLQIIEKKLAVKEAEVGSLEYMPEGKKDEEMTEEEEKKQGNRERFEATDFDEDEEEPIFKIEEDDAEVPPPDRLEEEDEI